MILRAIYDADRHVSILPPKLLLESNTQAKRLHLLSNLVSELGTFGAINFTDSIDVCAALFGHKSTHHCVYGEGDWTLLGWKPDITCLYKYRVIYTNCFTADLLNRVAPSFCVVSRSRIVSVPRVEGYVELRDWDVHVCWGRV